MGISASRRVKHSLSNSSEFNSACESAYNHCTSLNQHAVDGVFPYQLPTAANDIHATLSTTNHGHPLILKWVPSPPTRAQIDSALRFVTKKTKQGGGVEEEEEVILGPELFKEWAVVTFAEAVVGNARKAVIARVPIGVVGIVGVGAATRSGRDLIGTAIGVYALGVATSIYLSLSG